MAERWQQWMPFYIDRFRGSPEVQAMHPSARLGYLYLLSSAWQTDDCSVSADPLDLATESGLGDELWAQYGGRILRNFKFSDGRYRNAVVFGEWEAARKQFEKNHGPKLTPAALSEARSTAGKNGANKRWQKNGKLPSENGKPYSKPIANDGLQEQEHIQVQTTKATTPASAVELPEWIDKEIWEGFMEVRRNKRAKPTERAIKGLLKQLGKFRNKGHDPNEVIENSIRANYTDVYEPKLGVTNAKSTGYDKFVEDVRNRERVAQTGTAPGS